MHFTPSQLRELGCIPEKQPEPEQPYESFDPYTNGLAINIPLSVLTSEAHALRLGFIPRSDEVFQALPEIHERLLRTVGITCTTLSLGNLRRDFMGFPDGIIDSHEKGLRLTKLGDHAQALGGLLLRDFSLARNEVIRTWTGSRMIRGVHEFTGYSTPQIHRLHIIKSLLPKGTHLRASEISSTGRGMQYNNLHNTLTMLENTGVLKKHRIQTTPPLYNWSIARNRRRSAEVFLNIVACSSTFDSGQLKAGQDALEAILQGPSSVPVNLYTRGMRSSGHHIRPEHTSLLEQIHSLFSQIEEDVVLTAQDIGEFLGQPLSTSRIDRLLAKKGVDLFIEDVRIFRGKFRRGFRKRQNNFIIE